MSEHGTLNLPAWNNTSNKRRDHIARVVGLLAQWAEAMALDDREARAWHDAGAWHDALRDADEPSLRAITGEESKPLGMLHGPASAIYLERDGEPRRDVLTAIRGHTVGDAEWSRTGRALYMADFLEPGRNFMSADRAFLASQVPHAFDDVFRQVVRMRLEWVIREGKGLAVETVALWNSVR